MVPQMKTVYPKKLKDPEKGKQQMFTTHPILNYPEHPKKPPQGSEYESQDHSTSWEASTKSDEDCVEKHI